MTDDSLLDKVLDKIRMIIGIGKVDDANMLSDTGKKLFDEVSCCG